MTPHGKRLPADRSQRSYGRKWLLSVARPTRTTPLPSITGCCRLLPKGGTHNARYDEAFEIVRAIGMLRTRLDERAEFTRELEGIRGVYRAKRNFIKPLAKLS